MKQKGNFVLRKLLDEYVLVPCKETAEQMIIKLSGVRIPARSLKESSNLL